MSKRFAFEVEAEHALTLYAWLLKGGVAIWKSRAAFSLGWLALPLNADGTVPEAPAQAEGEPEVLTDASQVRVFRSKVWEGEWVGGREWRSSTGFTMAPVGRGHALERWAGRPPAAKK